MKSKKQIRADFRQAVFERDCYHCVMCGRPGKDRQGGNAHLKHHGETETLLDAHHITNRKFLPGGGYVPENGISLCDDCHVKAEGDNVVGFKVDDLYAKIGSDYTTALELSTRIL